MNLEKLLKEIRAIYPKRTGGQGWGYVRTLVERLTKRGVSPADLLAGVKRYAALMDATNTTRTPYVMQARTFFGPGEWWDEEYEIPESEMTNEQKVEELGVIRKIDETQEQYEVRVRDAILMKEYG